MQVTGLTGNVQDVSLGVGVTVGVSDYNQEHGHPHHTSAGTRAFSLQTGHVKVRVGTTSTFGKAMYARRNSAKSVTKTALSSNRLHNRGPSVRTSSPQMMGVEGGGGVTGRRPPHTHTHPRCNTHAGLTLCKT